MDFRIKNELAFYPKLEFAYLPVSIDPLKIYNDSYFNQYKGYENGIHNSAITSELNKFRCNFVNEFTQDLVIDIGCGYGTFIKRRQYPTLGYDINPRSIEWLKKQSLYIDPYEEENSSLNALSFWDSLEHIPEPDKLLRKVKMGGFVFVTVPIFEEQTEEAIKKSKHYRPLEHCWYFSKAGLCNFMQGFKLLEMTDDETNAGREGVMSFAFQKGVK